MTTAVYPGTFDPVHFGHIDIAQRASKLFDHVIVAVYSRPLKNLLFSTEERIDMMKRALEGMPNVQVDTYNGLTVDYVRNHNARAIVRGLRVTSDFEFEYQMALTNKKLAAEIETVCFMTNLRHAFLSSSIVKEVAVVGGCVDQMVPDYVAVALRERFKALGTDGGGKVQLVSLRD